MVNAHIRNFVVSYIRYSISPSMGPITFRKEGKMKKINHSEFRIFLRLLYIILVCFSFSIFGGSVQAQSILNLTDLSPQAKWASGKLSKDGHSTIDNHNLPWMGAENDSRGFVRLTRSIMEDGKAAVALRMHPMWVNNGTIKGWHPWIQLSESGTIFFKSQIGFLKGAKGTDGVIFMVWEHHMEGGREVWNLIASQKKRYTGSLDMIIGSLSHLAGKKVGIELRVDTGPSSGQDWAAWVNPQVVTKWVNVTRDSPGPVLGPIEPKLGVSRPPKSCEGEGKPCKVHPSECGGRGSDWMVNGTIQCINGKPQCKAVPGKDYCNRCGGDCGACWGESCSKSHLCTPGNLCINYRPSLNATPRWQCRPIGRGCTKINNLCWTKEEVGKAQLGCKEGYR